MLLVVLQEAITTMHFLRVARQVMRKHHVHIPLNAFNQGLLGTLIPQEPEYASNRGQPRAHDWLHAAIRTTRSRPSVEGLVY